jgi:hypothetical protein
VGGMADLQHAGFLPGFGGSIERFGMIRIAVGLQDLLWRLTLVTLMAPIPSIWEGQADRRMPTDR